MRLVVAVIKPGLLESVRQALATVQVTRMTVCDVHGYDRDATTRVSQEVMLEIAVNADFVDQTVRTLGAVLAASGDSGGRVFVMPVVEAVQLYRGVRGPEAV
ncbi:MAG: P-II family nitrogen regulator [Pirellulales bacterium]